MMSPLILLDGRRVIGVFHHQYKKLLPGIFACLQFLAIGAASAQTTFNFTGTVQTYTIPAGAGGIQIQAAGAGGGGGGSDASGNGFSGAGGAGSKGALAKATFFAAPGTIVNVYVGGGGGLGYTSNFGKTCTNSAGASGNAGGSGGFAGGAGGAAGCSGYSGGGGGGGAASVVANASNVTLLIAGSGSGGQGGSWMSAPNTTINSSAQGLLSAASVGGTGLPPNATDGGAGGGGGGGCAGGAGGDSHLDQSGNANGNPAVAGGSCPNTALVSNFSIVAGGGGAGGAGAPGDPSNTANGGQSGSNGSVVITPLSPTLGLVKSAPAPALQVGQNSSYVLTLTNSATTPAFTATIRDQLPANLSYVSSVGSNWSCSNTGGLVSCNFTGGTIAASGGTITVTITVTPTSTASATNFAAVDPTGGPTPPTPTTCTAQNAPSAGCAAPVTSNVGRAVGGTVYNDSNHNGNLDAGESGPGVATLFVKLAPSSGGGCSGPAIAAAAVDSATGAYSLPNVAVGSYCLILDNNATLADVTAGLPAGRIGTQNPSGVIQITVAGVPVPPQNFGLYNGSILAGTVFADTGVGSGTPNNGIKDGGEAGLAGVTVNAQQGGSVLASTSTAGDGSYILWLTASVAGAVSITPTAPSVFLATGGSTGTTAGSYARPSVSYTPVAGQIYTGVNFGLVPPNTLAPNGAQTASPGTSVVYAHNFQAGSGGQVSFSLGNAASPASPAWSQVLYLDSNCNGVIDVSEVAISAPLSVSAGQSLCLIVKQFVPAGAPVGGQNIVTLSAAFSYTNAPAPALASNQTATDITSVSQPGGLTLGKLVSNVTQGGAAALSVNAKAADTLQYTLTAVNNGSQSISAVVISDATPAYTTYLSAACSGPLPAGMTACSVSTQPAAGAQGGLQWSFTGSLTPGAQLKVTYLVKVDQ